MLILSEEALSPAISLWRVYPTQEARDRKGPFIGAFVLIADGGSRVAKGFVIQKPYTLGMQEVREIAERIAALSGADTLVIERHGRWIRVDLFSLKVEHEKETGQRGDLGSSRDDVGRGESAV